MVQSPSITPDPSPHPALSYSGLWAEALELLGRLCGDQWSDFNSHDPGITILEQLCFALTELAYRSQWPIADLIASAGPDWQPEAEAILHGDPVTQADLIAFLRALGCQAVAVEAVERASLSLLFRPSSLSQGMAAAGPVPVAPGPTSPLKGNQPTPLTQPEPVGDLELRTELELRRELEGGAGQSVTPRGVWRVSVQLGSGAAGQGPASLLPIAHALHGVRLLGRDFELAVLDPFKVIVRADLEVDLGPNGSASALLARIAAVLDATIRRDASVGDGRGLRSAALIQSLQALPEVREVCCLLLAQDPADPGHPLHLALPKRNARLDPASPIRLLHHGLPLSASASPPGVGTGASAELSGAIPSSGPMASRGAMSAPVALPVSPAGRPRKLTNHRSIARQLPAVYGVGPAGLPADASPERRAQAMQLRAYLLFFDQLMANAQAQLALAPRLLSPIAPSDPEPLRCEGVLLAEDPDLPAAALRKGDPDAWEIGLRQALRRSFPASAPIGPDDRRAALLAHLLQRFGEELTPPSALMAEASPQARATELVRARSAYLRRIASLTGGRGSGPDLLAPLRAPPAPGAAPPAEAIGQGACAERLRRQLGLPLGPDGAPPLLVIEHLLLRPLEDDKGQMVLSGEEPIPFLSDVARPDPWTGRVSVVINAALLQGGWSDDEERWLARRLRQELPAHLAVELHLLADGGNGAALATDPGAASGVENAAQAQPPASEAPVAAATSAAASAATATAATVAQRPWSAVLEAWQHFRSLLAAYRLSLLTGAGQADDPLPGLRLRDSRDRLIQLLRIGQPWPLRSIPLDEQLMVASGQSAAIKLPFSQKGVRYQLIEVNSGTPCGEPAFGNGGPLTLTSPPITADLTLRVRASVLAAAGVPGAGTAEGIALTASARPLSALLAGEVRVVEGVDMSLSLRLHAASHTPLPFVHPEGMALLADHGQQLVVEVVSSQEGVVYEVIDDSQRDSAFERQVPLSPKVVGTSGSIWLELSAPAAEDRDLTVRASLDRRRGKRHSEDRQVLRAVLPLRVRANPAVPLALITPVVEADASTTLVIGAEPATVGAGSQASVAYELWARSLSDEDWRFDDPASAPELTTVDTLDGFIPQAGSGQGNGACLRLDQRASGEGLVVAALARKHHRLGSFRGGGTRTSPSALPLRQAAVLFTRPDRIRPLLLRRETEAAGVWSLWGGQPGVAYSLVAGDGETARPLGSAVPIPETDDAPSGRRGIGRQRLERDLVVVADDGAPRTRFDPDPSQQPGLQVRARFLRSGSEVAMAEAPLLAWADPPAVGRGEAAVVLVSGLAPSQPGQLRQGGRLLGEAVADPNGSLRLATGPLAGASQLELDVGVCCPLPIAQGVNTDLTVRLRNGQPLLEGAPAQLVDWGCRAEVEVIASQRDVTYVLIAAADRDKPPGQQRTYSEVQPGTGAALVLLSTPLREDVDLLVLGTRRIDAQGDWRVSGVLQMVVPLRVRANPAVPLALAQPLLEPTSPCQLWVGDGTEPSQSSVTYKAWAKPLQPEHWQWREGQDAAPTPLLPSHPDAVAPELDWTGRGQPKKGTDGDPKRGQAGRLQLTLGQAGSDAYLAVIASKQHSPHPLAEAPDPQGAASVTSQVVLNGRLVQLTTPNPDQRLALVARGAGWRLVGGEPGCSYTFQRRSSGLPLAEPVYVHQRTTDGSASDWGIDRLRLGVDLVVAGGEGAGLDGGPSAEALLAAGVEARRAFSGTATPLRLGPLVVTLEPPADSSADTATVVVQGLAPGERVRLRQSGQEPREAVSAAAAVRLGTGPAPLGGEILLDLDRPDASSSLTIPVRLVLPGQASA